VPEWTHISHNLIMNGPTIGACATNIFLFPELLRGVCVFNIWNFALSRAHLESLPVCR
jgi:hypothetical protein